MAADGRLPPNDTVVRARPLGWNEELTAEQEYDLEPLSDEDRARVLEGPLRVVHATAPSPVGPLTLVLVGGQEADPDTVEVA